MCITISCISIAIESACSSCSSELKEALVFRFRRLNQTKIEPEGETLHTILVHEFFDGCLWHKLWTLTAGLLTSDRVLDMKTVFSVLFTTGFTAARPS